METKSGCAICYGAAQNICASTTHCKLMRAQYWCGHFFRFHWKKKSIIFRFVTPFIMHYLQCSIKKQCSCLSVCLTPGELFLKQSPSGHVYFCLTSHYQTSPMASECASPSSQDCKCSLLKFAPRHLNLRHCEFCRYSVPRICVESYLELSDVKIRFWTHWKSLDPFYTCSQPLVNKWRPKWTVH